MARMPMILCTAALVTVAASPAVAEQAIETEAPAAQVSNLQFQSAFWMNLHHTLYGAAWARRPEAGTLKALAGALPAPLDAPLTAADRAAWTAAVDYYEKELAARDLLFDRGMGRIKMALVGGELADEAIAPELRRVLESAAPVYRRHYWRAHDEANRTWIAAAADRLRALAPETIPRLEKFYGVPWFDSAVRVDVVWVGNRQGGYTTNGRVPHVVMSSGDRDNAGWTAVEIVFHEVSHALVLPLQGELTRALGDRVRDHGILWHVIQFYLTGIAVQQTLRARDVDYVPYLYATRLIDRAWPKYRTPVETAWRPFVEGKSTRAEAIAATLKALGL